MINGPIRRVRVILPSSPIPNQAAFDAGLDWLRAEGVTLLVPAAPPPGPLPFLAGPDLGRAQELGGAFAVEDVDAVWCARGGSGAQRTLSALDAVGAWAARVEGARDETMPGPSVSGGALAGGALPGGATVGRVDDEPRRRAPGHGSTTARPSRFAQVRRAVPLVGLSDATALLLARLHDDRPGVAIHGPVITQLTRLDAASATALRAWLADPTTLPVLRASPARVHVAGRVEGTLVAGNLALLASCCGTPEQPRLDGAVLLVEEIGEPAYRIDRMMAQLARSGALHGLRGLALGSFEQCTPPDAAEACLAWWARRLDVPCLGGLPVGHGSACWPVALGLRYLLAAEDGLLAPLENVHAWLHRTAVAGDRRHGGAA